MKDHFLFLLLLAFLYFSYISSQRIPQSFFPVRQDSSPYANTSLPSSHLPSPPNYDHPQQFQNQQQIQYQPSVSYQPTPYTPHQIAAYDPVQNLNQIGRVDPVQSYDQSNPYGNENLALNLGPLNQARVPVINDPTLIGIAQYANPQIPEILRNSVLNVPHVDNQINYNLISPNNQNPTLTQNPERPSGHTPNTLPQFSNGLPLGGIPAGASFQYNPYAGLFNQSNQQVGYPLQLPHFSYPNNPSVAPNNNPRTAPNNPSGQRGGPMTPNPGWFQANPNPQAHPTQQSFQNPYNSGPVNLHSQPPTVPPLKVPQLHQLSQYTPPPPLPFILSPGIPTQPPNLFIPPTLPPDARNPYLVGSAGIVSPAVNPFSLPFSSGALNQPPAGLSMIATEEIPWDDSLLIKGGLQYRSSEMSAPLKLDVSSFLSWILPGTKWCGDGNRATHDDDLGRLIKTDRCCRKHDFCFDSILPRQTKYNLTNTGPIVRLHCDCDLEFHRCLKRANTFASVGVGIIFFNILQSRCFKQEYPIVQCVQLRGRTCEQFELDKSKGKVYQWFENPKFPIPTENLFSEKNAVKIGVAR